jgi:hypothetical protein
MLALFALQLLLVNNFLIMSDAELIEELSPGEFYIYSLFFSENKFRKLCEKNL